MLEGNRFVSLENKRFTYSVDKGYKTYRNHGKTKPNDVQHNIGDSRFFIRMFKRFIVAEETSFVWSTPEVEHEDQKSNCNKKKIQLAHNSQFEMRKVKMDDVSGIAGRLPGLL